VSIKSSCVPNIENDRFVVVRRSWVSICQGNHCAAALLNFFVSWHDWKIENQPRAKRENDVAMNHGVQPSQNTSLIQHHTIAELKDGLVGLYSDKTIQKAINLLVDLGFIQKSRNPDPRYKFDQTKHYLVITDLIKSALSAFGKNAECIKQKYQMEEVKIPDETVKIPDEAVFFLNHYQDTYQNNYQDPSSTHTDPDRACENSESEIFSSDPEPCQTPIIQPLSAKESASTNNSPSEEDLPPPVTKDSEVVNVPDCDISSVARFDRNLRTYQPTEDLTAQLVEIYNKVKPEHWGKCLQIGVHMPRQVASLLRRYDSPELVIQEWGEACLALKSNDFYNSAKFQSANINFLLDPTKTDRIPQLAQAWRDRPQPQKEQLAQKMVAASNGIPRWENPDVVLSGAPLHMRRLRYRRYIKDQEYHRADCPSIEYLQTYFPELFNENV